MPPLLCLENALPMGLGGQRSLPPTGKLGMQRLAFPACFGARVWVLLLGGSVLISDLGARGPDSTGCTRRSLWPSGRFTQHQVPGTAASVAHYCFLREPGLPFAFNHFDQADGWPPGPGPDPAPVWIPGQRTLTTCTS